MVRVVGEVVVPGDSRRRIRNAKHDRYLVWRLRGPEWSTIEVVELVMSVEVDGL